MLNPTPNFDMKNPRGYPTFENSIPIEQDNVPTGKRIRSSFSSKVVLWGAFTVLIGWTFFEKPFFSSVRVNPAADWLCFAGGLILVLMIAFIFRKRATGRTSLWLRIPLTIAVLAAGFVAAYFLGNNNLYFSVCEGGVVGLGIWRAIAAYHTNWTASSRQVYFRNSPLQSIW